MSERSEIIDSLDTFVLEGQHDLLEVKLIKAQLKMQSLLIDELEAIHRALDSIEYNGTGQNLGR